jgi:hypothetical protein
MSLSEKRTQHFKAWLSRLEDDNCPVGLIERVKIDIGDKDPTYTNINKVVLNVKHYEYVPGILAIIRGKKVLTEEKIQKMMLIFEKVSEVWEDVCKEIDQSRRSFLPYMYVLDKLLESIGEPEYYEYKRNKELNDKYWETIIRYVIE